MNKNIKTALIVIIGFTLPAFLLYKEYNPNATKPHWTYAGEHAISAWGDDEANRLCSTGNAQSPIDVPKTSNKGTDNYKFTYTETKFEGENNGHAVEYTPEKGSQNTLELNGKVYNLVQFHFHNPSEHALDGVLYPMEAHFVHKSADGKIAVVATMIEVNEKPTMKEFWKEGKEEKQTKTLNLSSIVTGGGKHYKGSLTTPPCSEGVEWLVLDLHQSMTQEEVNRYRKIMGSETNRPVQPKNGREVTQA